MKISFHSVSTFCLSIVLMAFLLLSPAPYLCAQEAQEQNSSKASSASPEEIKALVADLGSSEYAKRENASRKLLEMGEIVAKYLQDAVKSRDPEVKMRAKEIMLKIGASDIDRIDPEVYQKVDELITPVMSSEHPNLRIIVDMGKKAAPSLVKICKEGSGAKPIYSMIALTRIADPRSFPALAEMFQRQDLNMTMPGYVAQIKDPRMLFHLIKAWQQYGGNASQKLREQVVKMAGTDIGDDPKKWMDWFMGKYSDKLK